MDDNQFSNSENPVPITEEIQPNVIPPKFSKLTETAIAFLKCAGYAGIWLGIELAISVVAGVLLVLLHPDYNQTQLTEVLLGWSIGMTFIRSIVVVLIYYLIFVIAKKSFFKKIKLSAPDKSSYIPTTVIGFTGQYVTLLALGAIMVILPSSWVDSFQQNSDIITSSNQILTFISVVFLAPLFEEIMCRGLILNTMRGVMNKWLAIVLSSLFFGLIHGNPVQIIYATALGILLGYLYVKYESILVPMLCHLVFNLTSMLNSYLDVENELITMLIGLVAFASVPIFILALVYVALKRVKVPEIKEEEPKELPLPPFTPPKEYNEEALSRLEMEIEKNTKNNSED